MWTGDCVTWTGDWGLVVGEGKGGGWIEDRKLFIYTWYQRCSRLLFKFKGKWTPNVVYKHKYNSFSTKNSLSKRRSAIGPLVSVSLFFSLLMLNTMRRIMELFFFFIFSHENNFLRFSFKTFTVRELCSSYWSRTKIAMTSIVTSLMLWVFLSDFF